MMVKKNIELNEQVVRLLKQHTPLPHGNGGQQYQSMESPSTPNPPEEWMVEENGDDIETALYQSKMEYEWAQSREEEEFQRLLEQACKESLKLSLSEQSGEQALKNSDLRTLPSAGSSSQEQPPSSTSSIPKLTASDSTMKSSEQVEASYQPATASCSETGAEAAAKWMESAKQEVASLPVPATSTTISTSKVVSLLCVL